MYNGQAMGMSVDWASHAGRTVRQWLWSSTCPVHLSNCENKSIAGGDWGVWIMVGNDFGGVAGCKMV